MALLPSPIILALRNSLRRRARLALTITTLMLATAIVISVLSVRRSLFETLEVILAASQHDIQVTLVRPHRVAQVERIAQQTPGVAAVESWGSDLHIVYALMAVKDRQSLSQRRQPIACCLHQT